MTRQRGHDGSSQGWGIMMACADKTSKDKGTEDKVTEEQPQAVEKTLSCLTTALLVTEIDITGNILAEIDT